MLRKYSYPLLLWLLVGLLLWYETGSSSYVWPSDEEALRRMTPALHTVQAVRLLLFVVVSLLALVAVRLLPSGKQQVVVLLLLLAGWGLWALTERVFRRYLAVEYYTLWKYQRFEKIASAPPLTPDLLPLLLRDVQDSTESFRVRDKLVLVLGEARIQQAYPILQAMAHDAHQNPDLQVDCLKALFLLRPQQFAAVLATSSDSAVALYRRYEL